MKNDFRNKTFHQTVVNCTGYEAIKKLTEKAIDDDILYSLGELYYAAGDYDAAFYKWRQLETLKFTQWAEIHEANHYVEQNEFALAQNMLLYIEPVDHTITIEIYWSLANLYKRQTDHENLLQVYHTLINIAPGDEQVYEAVTSYFEEQKLYTDLFMVEMLCDTVDKIGQQNRVLACLEHDVTGELSLEQLFEVFMLKLIKQTNRNIEVFIKATQKYMKKHCKYERGVKALATAIQKYRMELGTPFIEQYFKLFINIVDGIYWCATSIEEAKETFQHVVTCLSEIPLTTSQEKILNSYLGKAIHLDEPLKMSIENLKYVVNHIEELAKDYETEQPLYAKYMLDYYRNTNKKILITGHFNAGKSSFINSLVEEVVLKTDVIPTTSAVTIIRNDQERSLIEWKGNELRATSISELEHVTTIQHKISSALSTSLIFLKTPNAVLEQLNVCLIDTPGFFDDAHNTDSNPTFDFLQLADEVWFMFAAEEALTYSEKIIIEKMMDIAPNMPISFIINKVDLLDEDELEELCEDVERKLYKLFHKRYPLYMYSSEEPNDYRPTIIDVLKKKKEALYVSCNIDQVIMYLKQLVKQMTVLSEQHYIKQYEQYKKIQAQSEQFKNYVAEVEQYCEHFVQNTIQEFTDEILSLFIGFYKKMLLHYIRTLANVIQYERPVELQVDDINEHLHIYACDLLNKIFEKEFFANSLSNWYEGLKPKLKNHLDQLCEKLKLNECNVTIEQTYMQLQQLQSEQLKGIPEVNISKVEFIQKNMLEEIFRENFGRIFGTRSNPNYGKANYLKAYLTEGSFQRAIGHYSQQIVIQQQVWNEKMRHILTSMTEDLHEPLQKNRKENECLTNEATIVKCKKEYLTRWELVNMKVEQLKVLFQ